MTRWSRACAVVGVTAIIAGARGLQTPGWELLRAQATPPPQSGQTFRTAADVVMVDVSVKQGNRPIAGLTVKDFELRDNGVLQRIEQVDAAAVPIDLTLVVDVSGFPASRIIRPPMKPQDTSAVSAEVAKVAALLRPTDRLRVLAVDTYVHQLVPLSPAAALPAIAPADAGGLASTYDALLAAILQPAEPNRRRVVIANISVFDTMSTVDAATVRDVASRTDTLLHIVLAQQAVGKRAVEEEFQCASLAVCMPTARSWVPHTWLTIQPIAGERSPDQPNAPPPPVPQLLVDGQLLQAGAVATGGALHQGQMVSAPSLAGTFAKAFDDFRQSYVLRYTPEGVKRPGWHEIKVTMPGGRGYTIHARNGYAIDMPPSAKPALVPGAKTAAAAVVALPDLMDAYASGDYSVTDDAMARVADPTRWIKEFDGGVMMWPGSLRSEAVFALELAAAGVFTRPKTVQDAARDLLQRYSRLVRPPLEPDDFERRWLRAALAMLQGRIAPEAAGPFVDRALARFPREPRFLLAQAIVTDQLFRGFGSVSFVDRPTQTEIPIKQASSVIERYEAAAASSTEVATDARIRLGWFLYRVGRPADALAQLDAAPAAPEDVGMEYLRHLFKGHVFTSQGKFTEAIAEARAAHVLVPEAQSARVVLMNALALRGDATDAETVAANIETAQRTADPWWGYWLGDFRWYPDALLTLRSLVK